jgi:hypothetical protein
MIAYDGVARIEPAEPYIGLSSLACGEEKDDREHLETLCAVGRVADPSV